VTACLAVCATTLVCVIEVSEGVPPGDLESRAAARWFASA
jgi:hypothetical protein